MSLNQADHDALPAHHFAVPGKRALPINDATHTRLAWDMVDRTHDLTDDERSEARSHILRRAHDLGVNTDGWQHEGVSALALDAMSLDVPVTVGHPNKRPFSGILTRIDKPSDGPPGGSGKRKVLVTKACAEAALPTLMGMAIDMAKDLSGHDVSRKIGIITGAEIVGDAVEIKGFFYAKDFPTEMAVIDKKKSLLGFSFELTPTKFDITAENIYRVEAGVFTGAAL